MTLYRKKNGDKGLYAIALSSSVVNNLSNKCLYVCTRIDEDELWGEMITNDYLEENFEKVDATITINKKSDSFNCDSFTYYEVIPRDNVSLDYIIGNEKSLKNKILVPLADGRVIPFTVQHIDNATGKVYFVADVSVGKSNMNDMNTFLDEFEKLMPKNLLDICVNIEHITPKHTINRKVALLSTANIGKDNANICTGADDIRFDGLLTEAERCLNDSNERTCWWWLDTEYIDSNGVVSASYFAYVSGTGYAYCDYASNTYIGVRPAFCIS